MSLQGFKKALGNVRFAVDKAQKAGLSSIIVEPGVPRDFKAQQQRVMAGDVQSSIQRLDKEARELRQLADQDEFAVVQMLANVRQLKQAKDIAEIKELVHGLRNQLTDIESQGKDAGLGLVPEQLPYLPSEIRGAIESDLAELSRCYEAQAYRSVVILCGRVLEVALHRKYFEATKTDLLEKAPGTGLGNLIAKLADKGVLVDPALTNQIHLINQVRVHSVHVKKDAFRPSKDQAHAMTLYTIDVLKKLFV
jgi:hypothetical protein